MKKRFADASYTVLERYLQENRAQNPSWMNIMLAFRRKLQQVPHPNKKLNVGGSVWLGFLICTVDMYENNRTVTSSADAVSYMYIS